MMLLYYFVVIFYSILICLNSEILAKKLNLTDHPKRGKIHAKSTPLVGGIVLLIPFSISIFLDIESMQTPFTYHKYFFIFSIFLVGLIDDKIELSAYKKILIIILISVITFYLDSRFIIEKIYFERVDSEFYFGKSKFFVTILCILLLFIAFNLADGINGLVASISLISIISFNVFFKGLNFDFLSICLIITLLILFYFNYQGKLFLGDSGSSFLAAYLIYISISENYFFKTDVFIFISPFLIMGIDMIRLFFLRIINKKNIFNRDNGHFHHILLRNFGSNNSILIYLLLSFSPIALSFIFNIEILYVLFFSVILYFVIIKKYH